MGGYVVAGAASYHRLDCTLHEAREAAHLVVETGVQSASTLAGRAPSPPAKDHFNEAKSD